MQNINIQDAKEQVVYVAPREEINLQGIDPSNIKVDVLGADFIITDLDSGSRLVFPNLGLILFSESDLPTFKFDGQSVSEDFLLSDVGLIQNISQNDLLSFTSLKTDPEQGTSAEELGTQGRNDEESEDENDVDAASVAELEAILYDIAKYDEPPTKSGQIDTAVNEASEVSEQVETEVQRQINTQEKQEEFQEPPAKKKSSTSTKQSDLTEEETEDIDIDFSVQIFDFTAGLVQQQSTSGIEDVMGTDSFVYRGGGGNETSFFTTDSAAQYSTEIIDASTQTGTHYIYADNPDYFSSTEMTRVIQMTPALADGFDISEIVLSGLPASFTVEGATTDGTDHVITSPTILSDGTIRIAITYDVPDPTSFPFTISATAIFDPSSGVPTPELTEVTQELTRNVIIQDVNSASDYEEGADTWVLANNGNANRIFTGTGDAVVYGNDSNDTVTAFEGNDTIYGGGGDDIIRTSLGDDYIDPGTGNNFMDAGEGNDTLDYSSKTDDIVIDLTMGGLQNVTIGAFTDQITGFENVISGSGNDTLRATNGDTTIIAGDGNDTVIGNNGDDRLEGGLGVDTIDYRYAGTGVTVDLSSADVNGDITVNVSGSDTDSINSFENINGSAHDDVLTGDLGNNVIFGGDGDDRIYDAGYTANGIDYFDGGDGTDYTTFSGASVGLTLDMSVVDSDGYAAGTLANGNIIYLKNFEEIRDTQHDDNIIGDANNNYFFLSGGNDTVDGGDGTDTVSFRYTGGGGITLDLVNLTATAGNGEIDNFSNVERFDGTNNDDIIYTSTGNDWVRALNGADYFYGSAGDDILYGNNGDDTIDYSLSPNGMTINFDTEIATGWGTDSIEGIDRAVGSNFDDVFVLKNFRSTIDGLNGTDTVDVAYSGGNGSTVDMSSVDGNGYFTLSADGDNHTIRNVENLLGSGGDDNWRGDAQNNVFDGRGGDDVFEYSLGNDTYIGGSGENTLDYTGYTNGLTVDMSVTKANGYSDITFDSVSKVDQMTQIEVFYGTDAGDIITGSDVNRDIYGGDGDDVITGGDGNENIYDGAGTDTIFGGEGNDDIYGDFENADNDTYDGGGGYDELRYNGAAGTIIIDAGAGTATGTEIGNNTISNFTAYFTGEGNDIFYGSAGTDRFFGNGGSDIFYSSGGNDRFYGGGNLDTANYSAETAGITMDISAEQISKSSGTDNLYEMERVQASNHDDTFLLNDYGTLLNYSSITGSNGNDSILVQTPTTFDGVNLASIFSEIEEIDFTASSLTGGDTFDLNGNDVKSLTDTSDYLHVTVNTGFAINVASGGTYALTGSSVAGDTTTYTFDNGGGDTVTLDVQTV